MCVSTASLVWLKQVRREPFLSRPLRPTQYCPQTFRLSRLATLVFQAHVGPRGRGRPSMSLPLLCIDSVVCSLPHAAGCQAQIRGHVRRRACRPGQCVQLRSLVHVPSFESWLGARKSHEHGELTLEGDHGEAERTLLCGRRAGHMHVEIKGVAESEHVRTERSRAHRNETMQRRGTVCRWALRRIQRRQRH